MASEELLVTVGLSATKFKSEMKKVNDDLKTAEKNFKLTEKTANLMEDGVESLGQKLKALTNVLDAQNTKIKAYKDRMDELKSSNEKLKNNQDSLKTKLQGLTSQYESVSREMGENSKEAKGLAAQIKSLENEMKKNESAIKRGSAEFDRLGNALETAQLEADYTKAKISKLQNELDTFDTNRAESELKQFENSMEGASAEAAAFGAHMTEIGQGLQQIGTSVAESGKQIIGAIGGLVDVGAEYSAEVAGTEFLLKNLDETTQSLINTTSELAANIGLTEKQYKDSATSIATYYKNMGMTTETTNELTESTMGLVADLAAITDMPFDDAMGRFKSGLMGNYEALDAFGINLSANTLQNSEFVKSLGKSWNSLTDNEKMMASYNEIVRQSSAAQGLAAQEAAEYGMQSKLLSERMEELKGKIGEKLLPTLKPFVEKINEVVGSISIWVDNNPELTNTILKVVGAIGVVLAVVGTLAATIGSAIIAFAAIKTAIVTAGISLMGIIGPIVGVIAAVLLLAGAVASNFEGITGAVGKLANKFDECFSDMGEAFKNTWEMLQDMYTSVVSPLFAALGEVVEAVVNAIVDCMPGISTVFKLVFDIVKGVWDTVGKPVFKFVVDVVGDVVDFIKKNLPIFTETFNGVCDSVNHLWNSLLKPTLEALSPVVAWMLEAIRPMWDSFVGIISAAFEFVCNLWNNLLKPVFDMIVTVVGWLVDKIKPFMEAFSMVISAAMYAVLTPIRLVIEAIRGLLNWVSDGISAVGGFLNKINPFRSIDGPLLEAGVTFNTEGIENLDMQHELYAARTPLSQSVANVGNLAKESENKSNSLLKELINVTKGNQEQQSGGIVLNIENFINNREQDIEQLCKELEFYRRKIAY